MFEAMRRAYGKAQEDETLLPLILVNSHGKPLGRIAEGDSVIFYNILVEREKIIEGNDNGSKNQ